MTAQIIGLFSARSRRPHSPGGAVGVDRVDVVAPLVPLVVTSGATPTAFDLAVALFMCSSGSPEADATAAQLIAVAGGFEAARLALRQADFALADHPSTVRKEPVT